MREIVHTDQAPAAIGPYSQGVGVCKIVFTANWAGNPQSDLVLYDPSVAETPQLLTPPINSA